MPVPSSMADLSTTAASNFPTGSESPTTGDDYLRAYAAILRATNAKGADIASASTTDIGAATGEFVDVTGTTTITALGTIGAGIRRTVRFTGILTLTHNATSLILPSSANITTANGDFAEFRSLGSGNWVCVNYVRKEGVAVVPSQLQAQTYQSFTTGGSSTAYTLTPIPALTALAANQRFNVTFNATAGANPTLAISGLTAKSLKVYDSSGAKTNAGATTIVANLKSDVIYDGTDYVVLDPVNPNSGTAKIQPITASVAANALTLTLNPTTLDFRSNTLGSGTVSTVSNSSAISLVISSGSTLGSINAVATRLAILAINNAGTMELAAVNISGGTQLDETNLISTTAEGGSGGADSSSVIYSTTARASVAYRVVGFIDYTQATAGTYATAPSTIQGIGGQALAALSSLGYGQTYQDVTGSRAAATNYYNTTGKPIFIIVRFNAISGNPTLVVGGVTLPPTTCNAGTAPQLQAIVPQGFAYSLVLNGTTLAQWFELR
jgi:hypothetical protein